jgi:CubicO group peptidase (beta-lactamase class C family)
VRAFALVDVWPVPHAGAVVLRGGEIVATHGDLARSFRLASVSKLITAWATLIAIEEGTVELDEAAGPPGATVRHLLAHAAGFAFDGSTPITTPGRKRIYSNTGYEVLAAHVEARTAVPFCDYVGEAILAPLGMTATEPTGSPAKDFRGTASDVARFAAEMQRPTLLAASTVAEATTTQFPELEGVLPGVGRFSPNPWGLGPELRGDKQPHWTGTRNSPRTYGHFGGAGTFVWVDPEIDAACVVLANREFDKWGLEHWPAFSDAVLGELDESS